MEEKYRKILMLTLILGFTVGSIYAQETLNTAGRMLQEDDKLRIGGYAQIDYNQPIDEQTHQNGVLDVHRLVLLFGYKFNEKTRFISEIEIEHVKEVYVEQAFLQYEIQPWLNFRGGLLLIPMGIINEYHEPPTFNGVERPNLDKFIVPTTWREIGAGFSGTLTSAAMSYQLYLVNGFNGYDDGPRLRGSDGFRKGRQKGAESIISSPNLSFRVNHFGIPGLQLGISGYTGKTQSNLRHGLSKNDLQGNAMADSSVVGLTMLGADARFNTGGWMLRAQLNYGIVTNSAAYNMFSGSDLGSSMFGWYGELAYNLFHRMEHLESALIPFFRFEQYNTHASVEEGTPLNPSYDRTDLTMGMGWRIASGAMLKVDYQLFGDRDSDGFLNQFNAGVAVWF